MNARQNMINNIRKDRRAQGQMERKAQLGSTSEITRGRKISLKTKRCGAIGRGMDKDRESWTIPTEAYFQQWKDTYNKTDNDCRDVLKIT